MNTITKTICKSLNIDACILVGTDPHQLEYPLPQFQIRHILSNFYGSAGTLIITRYSKTALWTDGRYAEAAKQDTDSNTEVFIDKESAWEAQIQWIIEVCQAEKQAPQSITIGISDIQTSVKNYVLLESIIKKTKLPFSITLRPIVYNDMLAIIKKDAVLGKTFAKKSAENKADDNPPPHKNPRKNISTETFAHLKNSIWILDEIQKQHPVPSRPDPAPPLQKQKLQKLEQWMEHNNINIYMSANTQELTWLTDLRSMYIHYLMVFPMFFYYNRNTQSLALYIPSDLHTEHTREHIEILQQRLSISIMLYEYDDFISNTSRIGHTITRQSPERHSVAYDPYNIPVALHNSNYTPIHSPITLWKSIASPSEIEDMRYTQQVDNVSLLESMASIGTRYKAKQYVSEEDASNILLRNRMRQPLFLQESFNTISAKGANAALPHYKMKKPTPIILEHDIYLLDSGAHYLYGTTDLTRVYYFGAYHNVALPQTLKDDYTYVLKAHIALASFTKTINDMKQDIPTGHDLDQVSRAVLNAEGRDYQHGTGHGIGYCTDVHDGIQRIGKDVTQKIHPNMIMSNEPGYYRPQQWGIRIENMMVSRINAENEFYFETLSHFPFQNALINKSLLTDEEDYWLIQYNQKCQALLFPRISYHAKTFFADLVFSSCPTKP